MVSNHKLKTLYTGAYNFLQERIGQKTLEDRLDHYRHYKATNMQDVFWHMVRSLKNKRNMGQTIGDIDALSPFLFDFDPAETYSHYGDDWTLLFKKIQNKYFFVFRTEDYGDIKKCKTIKIKKTKRFTTDTELPLIIETCTQQWVIDNFNAGFFQE